MARISMNDSGRFGSSQGGEWFTLRDDGDAALVTFLYTDPDGEDVDYFLVHETQIDGSRKIVNCNAGIEGGELHEEDCELCMAGYPRIEKLYLQLYNHETGRNEIWDRGRSYVSKISTYINKYGSLLHQPFEIVRKGRAGDQSTTYEFLEYEPDPDATLDSYEEKVEILGSLVLDATNEDMLDIIDGRFTLRDDRSNGRDSATRRGATRRSESATSPSPTRSRRSAPSSRRESEEQAAPREAIRRNTSRSVESSTRSASTESEGRRGRRVSRR